MFIQTSGFNEYAPHVVKWSNDRVSYKEKTFTTFYRANGFAESMKKRGFRVSIIPVLRSKEEIVKHYIRRVRNVS